MKKQLFVAATVILFATSCRKETTSGEAIITEAELTKPVAPASQKYIADTLVSNINWIGTKPTGSHSGTIKLKDGVFFIKENELESGKFTIDMNSITVTDPKEDKNRTNLENHLKGLGDKTNEDHFFNVTKYPISTFEITNIAKAKNQTLIEGNLTIKEITKNITFPAFVSVNDSTVILNSESFKINRTLWNINYNSKSAIENLGDQYIDDNIELKVSVTAKRNIK